MMMTNGGLERKTARHQSEGKDGRINGIRNHTISQQQNNMRNGIHVSVKQEMKEGRNKDMEKRKV